MIMNDEVASSMTTNGNKGEVSIPVESDAEDEEEAHGGSGSSTSQPSVRKIASILLTAALSIGGIGGIGYAVWNSSQDNQQIHPNPDLPLETPVHQDVCLFSVFHF